MLLKAERKLFSASLKWQTASDINPTFLRHGEKWKENIVTCELTDEFMNHEWPIAPQIYGDKIRRIGEQFKVHQVTCLLFLHVVASLLKSFGNDAPRQLLSTQCELVPNLISSYSGR